MNVLLTTIHDPEGRFAQLPGTENAVKNAVSNYSAAVASVTEATAARTKKLVSRHFECTYSGTGTQGHHITRLMKDAVGESFHYCDFDRLVHWQTRYPRELEKTAGRRMKGFVLICRTKRAFGTHPETQKDTETVMNMIASEYIGRKIDIGSGTFGLDRRTCELFSKIKGDVSGVRFLAHFLVCIKKNRIPFSCMMSEGVEWETPDIHRKEIKALGYKKWLSQFQSHGEWCRRVEMLRQVAEVLTKN